MRNDQMIRKVLSKVGKNYKVERADFVKKEDLIDFFKIAYSDQFNAADYQNEEEIIKRWEWANLKNPNIYDKQFPSWVCKDNKNSRIVGHFGIIPVSLRIKSFYYPSAWGRNLIVLHKFRELTGIGPFLVDSILKNIKDKIALFLLAGLNESSYTLFERFGFIDLGYIPLYVRINRLDNILQSKMRNKMLGRLLGISGGAFFKLFFAFSYIKRRKYNDSNKICITEVANFDDSFDNLWEKLSPHFPIIIKRDSLNLNWRFVNQPYGKYRIFKAESKKDREIKGYIVLREGKSQGLRVGIISDLFAQATDIYTIASLVNFSIKYFEKKNDVDLIRCDILHKNFAYVLKEFGFIGIRSNSRFMVGNIHQDLDLNFIVNRDNWFIDYADSDLDLSAQR